MPVIHEEVDSMVFGRDRIGMILRDALEELCTVDIELIAARSACFSAHGTGDNDRALLGKTLQRVECLFGQVALDGYALDQPTPITNERENNLAGLTQVVKPAANTDALSYVPTGFVNADVNCRAAWRTLRFRFYRFSVQLFTHNRLVNSCIARLASSIGCSMPVGSRNSSRRGY